MNIRNSAKILMDEIHEKKVCDFFRRWLKAFHDIDCFAILVMLPNNEMLHLSTNPSLSRVYDKNNFGLFDQPTKKEIYDEFSIYPWRMPNANRIQKNIHTIREEIFGLYAGTNIVRKIKTNQGWFHIIFCISSYEKKAQKYVEFAANIKIISEACDFSYNTLLPALQESCELFNLPKIDQKINISDQEIKKCIPNYIEIPGLNSNIDQWLNGSSLTHEEDQIKQNLRILHGNNSIINNSSKRNTHLQIVKNHG